MEKKNDPRCRTTKTDCHFWDLSHKSHLLVISHQLDIKRVIRSENNVGIADCGLEWQIPSGRHKSVTEGSSWFKGVDSVNCALCETAQALLIASIKLQTEKLLRAPCRAYLDRLAAVAYCFGPQKYCQRPPVVDRMRTLKHEHKSSKRSQFKICVKSHIFFFWFIV